MTSEDVLAKLPDLSGSAAKLLIHRVATRGAEKTNRELMRETGIRKEHTLIEARRELRLSELWVTAENGLPFMDSVLPIIGNPLPIKDSGLPISGSLPRPRATVEGTVVHQEEKTFRQRAMEADLMDDSGDWRVPDAPCNLRRAEQIKVLSQAWAQAFPDDRPLIVPNAKRLLVLAGNSAEDVLDHIEEVQASPKQITYPFAYIQGYYQRQQQVAPQVKAVEIGKPARDEAGEYMMSEPSERSKMLQERLAARGMLRRDEEDD